MDGGGKFYVFQVSGRRSKVKMAGKKAEALRGGMNWDFCNFDVGDLARDLTCE